MTLLHKKLHIEKRPPESNLSLTLTIHFIPFHLEISRAK
jgi:hypothetical protein